MALSFKRSRGDTAHERTYPNASATVIFRNDVSNKNLLKNPFRTSGIPVGPVGVQNRPPNKMVDDRGAMYGGSVSVLRKDITNTNLLMNPYRFKTDPIDEPRTLSRQVILDINSGKMPQYIRENRGIDEIAFMIVKALPDNGVKLATLSMLKSYITGTRLQSVLDQGGQNVVKAFDVFNQLVVTCTSLYKTGMLQVKLPGLLLKYSEDIAKVFNESVLQPVSPILMFTAINELSSVSSVLTKLFRSQNAISPPTNVAIDEWARQEAAKIQALNAAQPVPVQVQQVAASGDNQPTGTQGVKDADTIKQEGTGKNRKKKKLSEMMGGAELNWGIANPSNTPLTPNPSLIQNGPLPPVNTMPPDPNASKEEKFFNKAVYIAGGVATIAGTAGLLFSGAKTIYEVINKNALIAELENKENIREGREEDTFNMRKIELLVRPDIVFYALRNTQYEDIFNRAYYQVLTKAPLTLDADSQRMIGAANMAAINQEDDNIKRLKKLADILVDMRNNLPLNVGPERENRRLRGIPGGVSRAVEAVDWSEFNDPANQPPQRADGRGIKPKKSKKSKTKKSKNLDAQILALLKA
jgi:hypothetical protein